MSDFVVNLSRSYKATAEIAIDTADGKQNLKIPCEFHIKPQDQLVRELEQFGEKHAEKVANSSLPLLWVALKSVDLENVTLLDDDGKKVPKKLWKDAVIFDPQLSTGIYSKYTKTILGNSPAAT